MATPNSSPAAQVPTTAANLRVGAAAGVEECLPRGRPADVQEVEEPLALLGGGGDRPLVQVGREGYEAGLKKMWLDNSLMTSVALFRTEQENLAEFAGYSDGDDIDDTDFSDDFDWALYRGISVEAQGFELEFAGRIRDAKVARVTATRVPLASLATSTSAPSCFEIGDRRIPTRPAPGKARHRTIM